MRVRTAFTTCLLIAAALVVPTTSQPAVGAVGTGSISSAGPLTEISISADLNCAISHAADSSPAFYGNTACATLVAVDGVLYGPASIPAGSGATPRTGYSTLQQTATTGSGSAGNPFVVATTVGLGDSGLELLQEDRYVAGSDYYSTDITVLNNGAAAKDVTIFRAADCYLANDDLGYGAIASTAVACLDQSRQRILQFQSLSPGAARFQAGFSSVWAAVGAQQMFDNTCTCDSYLDNGLGLSWSRRIPGDEFRTVTSQVAFTPDAGADDRDHDGLKDDWELNGVDVGGVHVPLPAYGADPDVPDVFWQIGWMSTVYWQECTWTNIWTGCVERSKDFAPSKAALQAVVDSFAARGVRLHVDAGSSSPSNPGGSFGNDLYGGMSVPYRAAFASSFDARIQALQDARRSVLPDSRMPIFHVAVIGDRQVPPGQGGHASSGYGLSPGDALFVAKGVLSTQTQLSRTLMHELGHNLGLQHGGPTGATDSDLNCKPAHRSVMNYLYQLAGSGQNYETQRKALQTSPPRAAIQSCIDSGAEAWPTEGTTYEVFPEWDSLVFDAGDVGGLSPADGVSPIEPFEPAYSAMEDAGLAAVDGDGGATIVGPTVLFAGVAGQQVSVLVRNPGNVPASYDVTVSPGPGPTTRVDLAAHSEATIQVPVDLAGASGSSLAVTAGLTSTTGQHSESGVTLPLLPYDPAAARNALAEAGDHEVPAEIKAQLIAALQTVAEPLANLSRPVIAGKARVGRTLSATAGVWSREAALTYHWASNGTLLRGATGPTLKLTPGLLGTRITLTVQATTADGDKATAGTAPVKVGRGKFKLVRAPKLAKSSKGTVGQVLKVKPGLAAPQGKARITWLRNGHPIRGAHSARYLVKAKDAGKRLAVRVQRTSPGYQPWSRTVRWRQVVTRR